MSRISFPPSFDGAGGEAPPRDPLTPPNQPKPPSLAPSSASPLPAVILVASTGIQSWTAFWIPAFSENHRRKAATRTGLDSHLR